MTRGLVRDLLLVCCMLAAFGVVMLNPARKYKAAEKIDLASFVPESFGAWISKTHDTANYNDQWQSINELLVRTYGREVVPGEGIYTTLNFILEYSSDLRKNFSFHFPETCHRAGGNEIEFMKPLDIELEPGRRARAKVLFIRGRAESIEKSDKVVVYWLVIDKKQYWQTFWIKVDQMLAGLLRRPKSGFLVRMDFSDGFTYEPAAFERAYGVISAFVQDLYKQLSPEARDLFFGAPA